MIHRCICSEYSLKAPTTHKRTKPGQRPQPTRLLSPRGQGLAVGREEPGGRWLVRQQVGAEQSAVALRAAEVSHLCLTQAAGRGRECGSLSIDPEPVLAGHGLGRQGRCYHSFFFSSMETPPGPRATTSSKPPITDMVWKKSYLRKSCMGL